MSFVFPNKNLKGKHFSDYYESLREIERYAGFSIFPPLNYKKFTHVNGMIVKKHDRCFDNLQ